MGCKYMRKLLLIFVGSIFLNGCVQSMAVVGPVITVASTGNIYQAGLSYGTNQSVKKITGKFPTEHVSELIDENSDSHKDNKIKKKLKKLLKAHIESTRSKIKIKE